MTQKSSLQQTWHQSLPRLNDEFCSFIDQSRRWKVPPKDIFAPAFFVENALAIPPSLDEEESVPPPPFPTIWLITSTKVVNGGATLIFKVMDMDGALGTQIFSPAPSGKWGRLDPAKQSSHGLSFMDNIVDACLFQIAFRERDVISTPRLSQVNAGRAKSNTPLQVVPPFINVRGAVSSSVPSGRGENPVAPHNRCGHYRYFKKPTRAGKSRTLIAPASIHGGSPVARNYKVGA